VERSVVLASSSPRRLALLTTAGFFVRVQVPDVDEQPQAGESPAALVQRLAHAKATAIVEPLHGVVAADTTVTIDGQVLNKPANDDDAAQMLRRLSGRSQQVMTGVCVVFPNGRVIVDIETTTVVFRTLTTTDIDAYLKCGEHLDKAGSYGIQGAGGVLVESISGCLTNVVGLPMPRLLRMMSTV
jgi:septum formation protein